MDQYDVTRLGLILAAQSEIEGMKCANDVCKLHQVGPIYTQSNFDQKAQELKNLAHASNDQLKYMSK
jgi:hypothetical protein